MTRCPICNEYTCNCPDRSSREAVESLVAIAAAAKRLYDDMLPHDYDPFWTVLGQALEGFALPPSEETGTGLLYAGGDPTRHILTCTHCPVTDRPASG